MIYKEVSFYDFEREFNKYRKRSNFITGLEVLYDFLWGLSEDTGEPIELDVIALCSEFHETSIKNALRIYDLDNLDELRDEYLVLDIDDETIIIGE